MHEQVHDLEIELTTKCNARCPQCVRNDHGGEIAPGLPLVDLDIPLLQSRIKSSLSNIKHVRLCGTYGDPCMHPQILDLVTWLVSHSDCRVTINTNGGMRNREWWQDLAHRLGDRGEVIFGIDGLEDTNHLYRADVKWSRLISNVQAFNAAGGNSTWMFLIFRHNQHQVETARAQAKLLGCKSFVIKSTARFLDKQHRMIDRSPVKNRQGDVVAWLEPTTVESFRNMGYEQPSENHDAAISCMAKRRRHLYISAEGYVLPCGWLHDRFYGVETEHTKDHDRLFQLINQSGGLDCISIHRHDLFDIKQAEFFRDLERSWQQQPLDRCKIQCGSFKTLYDQNNLWHG
jgi:MoaA/NifB/PqqE/SkfB family radical SAM enzyme